MFGGKKTTGKPEENKKNKQACLTEVHPKNVIFEELCMLPVSLLLGSLERGFILLKASLWAAQSGFSPASGHCRGHPAQSRRVP